MLRAAHLLVDGQRALEEWPCRRKVALDPEYVSEVDEASRGLRMIETESFLRDRQCALK
jgi:hypothetical protein